MGEEEICDNYGIIWYQCYGANEKDVEINHEEKILEEERNDIGVKVGINIWILTKN